MAAEYRAVAAPVAIQAHPPEPTSWQADSVAVIAAIGKINDHDHIVARPSLITAVTGDDLVDIVHVMDVDMLSLESPCGIEPITPQANEVSVQCSDADESVGFGPIEFARIRPGAPFQKFLAHEDHGDAGRRE